MPMNVVKDIRRIYAGLNTEQIRDDAHRPVNAGLIAGSEPAFLALEEFLAPSWLGDAARQDILRTIRRVNGEPHSQLDFLLAAPGMSAPRGAHIFDPSDPNLTLKEMAEEHGDIELAMARLYPRLRQPVANRIIHRVARENALFALVTALPNVVPSVLDLPWAIGEFATDTAFLTMNQIRMALLMAALYGHNVGYAEQKVQIATIAAGAFGWRALARELVGKIPLGGGLIPKAAVAFAGTYVVGLGLEQVNRTGRGMSKSERRDAWAGAFVKGKEVVQDMAPSVIKPAAKKT